jgi:anti-sigma B factor antagonist
MSESPARFEVRQTRAPQVHRLTPIGELDIASAPVLERAIESARTASATTVIVVDLTDLAFIDSSGIAALMRANESCAGRLRVVNGSPAVQRLFELTGVREVLPVIANADDPLAPL